MKCWYYMEFDNGGMLEWYKVEDFISDRYLDDNDNMIAMVEWEDDE